MLNKAVDIEKDTEETDGRCWQLRGIGRFGGKTTYRVLPSHTAKAGQVRLGPAIAPRGKLLTLTVQLWIATGIATSRSGASKDDVDALVPRAAPTSTHSVSSPMPAVTPFDVYRDQLAALSLGVALWNPNPPKEFYDYVSIGDVGYLYEGTFIRMFNVMLKWDDPLNRKLGVPEPYEPLDCGQFANTMESRFEGVDHYSRYVSTEPNSSNIHARSPDE